MKKNTFFVLTIFTTLTSCGQVDPNKNIDEGKVNGNFYTSNEIGWTIEIPKGWTIIEKSEKQELNKKGENAIEETVNADIDFSGLKNLIAFQKNQFNVFQSTSEPFAEEYEGEWEDNDRELKKIVYSTYIDQGIKVDTSATTIEKIGDLNFHSYSFTIYSRNGEVILRQIMFGRLINGLDFGVNISYNNEKDRDEMLGVFRKSKFTKK